MEEDPVAYDRQTGEKSLRLPQAIGDEDRSLAISAVLQHPVLDSRIDDRLWFPVVDGQSESGFCNKAMTGDGFESAADPIILRFIVPADYPHLSLVFDPDLGRPDDMTGRVQRDLHAIEENGLTPFHTLIDMIAQSQL